MLAELGERRQGARRRAEPGAADVDAAGGPRAPRRHQPRPGPRHASSVDDDAVRVGALARHARSSTTRRRTTRVPLLRQALRHVAHPTIRNRGTTVGSLVHADPAAEMPAVLVLLDGSVDAAQRRRVPRGRRRRTSSSGRWSRALRRRRAGRLRDASGGRPRAAARRSSRWPAGTGDYALCGVGAVVTLDATTRHRPGGAGQRRAPARCWSTCRRGVRRRRRSTPDWRAATWSTPRSSRRTTSMPAPTTAATSRTC